MLWRVTRIGFADPPFISLWKAGLPSFHFGRQASLHFILEGRPIQVVVLKEIKAYRFAQFLFFNPTLQASLRISLKNKNLPPKGGKLLFL